MIQVGLRARYSPASAEGLSDALTDNKRPNNKISRNLSTVGFDSELQLVKAILACASRARRLDYRVELEVDASVGIADVVLAKRRPRTTRELKALASVNPRLAVLLNREVCSNVASRAHLASCLGTTESGARKVIAQLVAAGLASYTNQILTLRSIETLPFERIIAVEAKLSEWQRVLVQAYRNLQFADESWVVLDHACVRPALAQLGRFRSTGVGLASVDRLTQGLLVHVSAATSGPVSVTKRWQAQAVLAARTISRRSPLEAR